MGMAEPSVGVPCWVVVHLDGGPDAEGGHGLPALLHAHGPMAPVGHIEANALILANLGHLG